MCDSTPATSRVRRPDAISLRCATNFSSAKQPKLVLSSGAIPGVAQATSGISGPKPSAYCVVTTAGMDQIWASRNNNTQFLVTRSASKIAGISLVCGSMISSAQPSGRRMRDAGLLRLGTPDAPFVLQIVMKPHYSRAKTLLTHAWRPHQRRSLPPNRNSERQVGGRINMLSSADRQIGTCLDQTNAEVKTRRYKTHTITADAPALHPAPGAGMILSQKGKRSGHAEITQTTQKRQRTPQVSEDRDAGSGHASPASKFSSGFGRSRAITLST